MRLALVTPYLPQSCTGNAHTAVRWRHFLRDLGHHVDMMTQWQGQAADSLITLHARRSHESMQRFAETRPGCGRILVLTGTDLYRDIHSDAKAQASLSIASLLVVLQEQGLDELPFAYRAKTHVIHQSAKPIRSARRPVRHFDICVVAHLRDEKAPFLAAQAAQLLPTHSRIRIRHIGGELQAGLSQQAVELELQTPRWHWLGQHSHGVTRRHIANSHLLVISSLMEGGANVISEAISAGTPVLASDIAGNIGMLGRDYPGFFRAGDAGELANLMQQAEFDPQFYRALVAHCARRASLFEPARERMAIRSLLEGLA